jgi:hypothetical protein
LASAFLVQAFALTKLFQEAAHPPAQELHEVVGHKDPAFQSDQSSLHQTSGAAATIHCHPGTIGSTQGAFAYAAELGHIHMAIHTAQVMVGVTNSLN